MSTSRHLHRLIARLLIGVLVFVQVAVAAYACPIMPAGPTIEGMADAAAMDGSQTPALDSKPGTLHLDSSQPNLCAAHCQTGQQNTDGKPAPTVSPAFLVTLYPVAPAAPSALSALAPSMVDDPPKAARPPLTILHCCYRI